MDPNDLSEAAAPAAESKPAAKPAKPEPKANAYEPMIHGESTYDRVTSMLMSVVVGASIIVGWLWLVYYTNQAYAKPMPAKVEIIEVLGGGTLDGVAGDQGAAGDDIVPPTQGSANSQPEDAGAFVEPQTMETTGAVLDPFAAGSDSESEGGEIAAETNVGGSMAMGPRGATTGKGTGRPLGLGPGGGGGVRREDRWVFDFAAGQSEDEYARLLDALGVELATPAGAQMLAYASHFTGSPISRTALVKLEKRLYFSWSNVARRQFDVGLLRKAGVRAGDGAIIIQFLPDAIQEKLAQAEFNYKGRQPAEIRRTRFRIVSSGSNFDFLVTQQEYLK